MVGESLPYALSILTHASSGIATSGCLERAPSAFKHGVGIPAVREGERERERERERELSDGSSLD